MTLFPLADARSAADSIVALLRAFCDRIEIAGSIRRQRPRVHDIDIVAVLGKGMQAVFCQKLVAISDEGRIGRKLPSFGPKLFRFHFGGRPSGQRPPIGSFSEGIQVDIYTCPAEEFPLTFLIRTGSKEHNIMLCQRARDLGMKLHADGSGMEILPQEEVPGRLAVIRDEEEVFRLLKLPYKKPEER